MTPGSVTVNEGAGMVTFTVTRSGGTPAETVYVTTLFGASLGYATNNGDYTGTLNQPLLFASGQISASVSISITNDAVLEATDETFGIVVQRNTSDPAGTFLAKSEFTIHDDDSSPTTYAMTPGSVTVNEGAGMVTFAVTRSGGTPAETVYVTTLFGPSLGYATNNGDYTGMLNQPLLFASGQISASVSISITNDAVLEATDETFGIVVQRNTSDPAGTFLAKSEFTIHDDDTAAVAGSVSIANVTIGEGDSGTRLATFIVTRTGGTAAFSVNFVTSDQSATVADGDYVAKLGTLSFGANVNTQTISVTVNGDIAVEPNQDFFVNLSGATNGATIGTASATGTIINDDTTTDLQTVTLQPGPEGQDVWVTDFFSNNDNFGVDNDRLRVGGWGDHYDSLLRFDLLNAHLPTHVSSATLRLYNVENNGASPTDMYVDQLHTAWDENYGWHDYSLSYTNIRTVAVPGLGWLDIDVTQAMNDWLATPSSNFGMQLRPVSNNNNFNSFVSSDAVGDFAQFRPELVVVATSSPTLSIAATNASQSEGNSGSKPFTFTVTRSGSTTGASSVNWAVTGSGANPANAADFASGVLPSNTVNFAAGDTTPKVITVNVSGDTIAEPDEGFTVTLSGASAGTTIGAASASGTILTDDLLSIAAKSDFNGDVRSDILWQDDSGMPAIWLMNGTNKIVGATISNPGASWHVKGSGDFNADTKSDILWQNDNGQVAIWLMNGTTKVVGATIGNPGASWHVIGTGDFNGDTKSDILWQNDNGTPAIWLMDGTNKIVGATIANPGASWHVKGSGNFNDDTKSDILWQNDDGAVAIWLMNGTTKMVGATIGNPGASWHVKGSGDFNGDTKSDILWQNDNGTPAIWLMDGTTKIVGATIANPGASWHVKGSGDFNGDTKSDILWQNDNGTPAIWLMNGTIKISGATIGNPGTSWHTIGSDGMRFINGATGNGTLAATSEDDMFVFTSYAAGAHVISGFNPAHDLIEFALPKFANFAAVMAQTNNSGGSAIITLDTGTLLIQGILKASLTSSDFKFV